MPGFMIVFALGQGGQLDLLCYASRMVIRTRPYGSGVKHHKGKWFHGSSGKGAYRRGEKARN